VFANRIVFDRREDPRRAVGGPIRIVADDPVFSSHLDVGREIAQREASTDVLLPGIGQAVGNEHEPCTRIAAGSDDG